MDYTLDQLNTAALQIGKAVVLRAVADPEASPVVPGEWNGATNLELAWLGETEGDIVFDPQENVGGFTLPERYGPDGRVRSSVVGANPILRAPLYLSDPRLRREISPTGDGRIGAPGRRDVTLHTVVVLPYALFQNPLTNEPDAKIRYTTAGGWERSAVASGEADSFAAFTDDETYLLGLSIWMWSGYWARPPITFRAIVNGDEKDIEEVTFQGQRPSTEASSGGTMVTIGDPADYAIDIAPVAP